MVEKEAGRKVREEVLKRIRRAREADLTSPLEIEIVARLMEGDRTATELTEQIFGSSDDLGAEYARVRRQLKGLESRGIVAGVTLFGRERPYRLTRYGISKLISLQGVREERLVPLPDIALYLSTLSLLAFVLFTSHTPSWVPPLFIFLTGASAARILGIIWKVS